jgi:hypothetical protein
MYGTSEKKELQENSKQFEVGITNNVERRIKQFGHPCVILNAKEYDTPQEAAQRL